MTEVVSLQSKSTVPKVKLIRKMAAWRLQYYVYATSDALKRNKQLALLIVLLLGPMLIALLFMMAKPLLALLSGTSALHSLLYWSVLSSISLCWVGMQRNALMGGVPNQYLQTLPIAPQQRLITDFYLLFSTNIILFIPYLIALFYCWVENTSQVVLHSVLIVLLMLIMVMLQLQFLYRIRWKWCAYFASFMSPISLSVVNSPLVAVALAMLSLFMFYKVLVQNQQSVQTTCRWDWSYLQLKAKYTVQQNLIRITLRQLLQIENRSKLILVLMTALLPTAMIPMVAQGIILQNLLWIRWKEQGITLFVSSVLLTVIITVVAGLQMTLKQQYQNQQLFLQCVGVSQSKIYQAQHFTLLLIGLFVTLPIVTTIGLVLGWLPMLLLLLASPLLFWSNIWMQRKPEELHVVAKILFFAINMIVVRLILGI